MTPNTPSGMDSDHLDALLAAGVPAGPLALAQRFYVASDKGKYHSESGCPRMRQNRPQMVAVFLLRADAGRFCSTCVDGPPSMDAKLYLRHANTAVKALTALTALRRALIEDRIGRALTVDDVELEEVARSHREPLELGQVSWKRVSQIDAIERMVASVRKFPGVHELMVEFTDSLHDSISTMRGQLAAAAAADSDSEALVRGCVVDLMGAHTYSSFKSEDNVPDGSQGPVPEPSMFPALCATSAQYGERYEQRGYDDLVTEAWRMWRSKVRATGDTAAAAAAALAATKLDTLEPKYPQQLSRTVTMSSAPSEGTMWDWVVAVWRAQAHTELTSILNSWAQTYRENLTAAADRPSVVIVMRDWELKHRTADNASTRVLAQLPVVVHEASQTGLAIAPGVVADWLCRYGVIGALVKKARYDNSTDVTVVAAAGPGDDERMLRTAYELWTGPRIGAYRPSSPMDKLDDALTAAQGIHATAA